MPKSLLAVAAAAAVVLLTLAPAAGAQPAAEPIPSPFTTPNTDGCQFQTSPPPPIDLSEAPTPGDRTPSALPVPAEPIGGPALIECGRVQPDGSPPLPEDISASGWVLADLDSGQVLAAKDPHGRYRPASTIKVLLAIVAIDELNLNTVITGTEEDSDAEGSRVGIGKAGTYTNRQLMQGLVMASGNDAAHALARQLGGDESTVAKMNKVAQSLGARDTRTASPSGLDGPGMSTSPYDLALIFRAAMAKPVFAELISIRTVEFPGYPKNPTIPEDVDHPAFALSNDNQLLHNYAGALGGKTGYTDDAGQTFVGAADRGRRLVVTLMAGTRQPIAPWAQATALLDYGFALDRGDSVGSLVAPGSVGAPSVTRTAAPSASNGANGADGADALAGSQTGSASGSDAPDGTLAVRFCLALIGLIVIVGLVMWARRLSRRR